MGEYTWEEFKTGCAALGCGSIASWTAALPRLRSELMNDEAKQKELYHYAFRFARERGMNNVGVEQACALWSVLIGEHCCGFLAKWKAFLMGKFERNEILVVAKDTWD